MSATKKATRLEKLLSDLYAKEGVPLDQLPYTRHMRHIHATFRGLWPWDHYSEGGLFWILMRLRKAGGLPRVGRAGPVGRPVQDLVGCLDGVQGAWLALKYRGAGIEADALAYTTAMRGIYLDFEARFGLSGWSEGDLYRVLVAMRKAGVLGRTRRQVEVPS